MEVSTRQIVSVTPFNPTCAWCLKAAGIKPKKGDSHGICELHGEIEYEEFKKVKKERKS